MYCLTLCCVGTAVELSEAKSSSSNIEIQSKLPLPSDFKIWLGSPLVVGNVKS